MAILRSGTSIDLKLLAILLVMVSGAISYSAETVTKEYQLKAAFIYNFAKFVEWPESGFSDSESPIVIGILGSNPFGDELLNTVKNRKIHGRAIEIRNIRNAGEARGMEMLFVSAGEERNFGALRNSLGMGVLSVGESVQFASHGGTINFNLEGDKLRFDINMAAAHRSGLKVSAQLQKLATTIQR